MNSYVLNQVWDLLLDKLAHATGETNMNMYIRQITPVKLENDIVYCTVPSATLRSSIQQKFYTIIVAALNEITDNSNLSLVLNVENTNRLDIPAAHFEQNSLFKKNAEEQSFEDKVNPKQRFDNFVVGNSNRFASAAAQAVANNPANVYNPLYIYGNSGLGKTHLLHAIGNAILGGNPEAIVKYVTSETFTNGIINAIKTQTVKAFQKKYRTVDCLIIDDIQFLAKKERTQEEVFHTFNTLRESGKQIVISCDRKPRDMDNLDERLRNRFDSGLTADIKPPDLETRIAIIRKKAEFENINMPNEVIHTIAASISDNVRTLEGAFTRIVAYANLMNKPIDLQITNEILGEFVSQAVQHVTIEDITGYICDYYVLDKTTLIGRKRSKNIAEARQIAMYLCRSMTDESFVNIGSYFGGKNHTTVIHACEKIDKMRQGDKGFDNLLKQFEDNIRKKVRN